MMNKVMTSEVLIFLATQALGFAGIVVAVYVKIMSRLSEFEIRLRQVEKQDDAIMNKLEEIAENLTDIKIDLNNKQNRL